MNKLAKIFVIIGLALCIIACTPNPPTLTTSTTTTDGSIHYNSTWEHSTKEGRTRMSIDSSIFFSSNNTTVFYRTMKEIQDGKTYDMIHHSRRFEQEKGYCGHTHYYSYQYLDTQDSSQSSMLTLNGVVGDTTCSLDSLVSAAISTTVMGNLQEQLLLQDSKDTLTNCDKHQLEEGYACQFCYTLYRRGYGKDWSYEKLYSRDSSNYFLLQQDNDVVYGSLSLMAKIENWNPNNKPFTRAFDAPYSLPSTPIEEN